MSNRTPEQTERLRTLSRELRKVPEKDFDIESYVGGEIEDIGCGSTACALGYCPLIFTDEWEFYKGNSFKFPCLKGNADPVADPFNEAEQFFGLSEDEAENLFDASRYEREVDGWFAPVASPSDVSNRIDAMLAETQP